MQCIAVLHGTWVQLNWDASASAWKVLQCVAVRGSMRQCGPVSCSAMQCVVACCILLRRERATRFLTFLLIVTAMNESYHICRGRVTYELVMSHVN